MYRERRKENKGGKLPIFGGHVLVSHGKRHPKNFYFSKKKRPRLCFVSIPPSLYIQDGDPTLTLISQLSPPLFHGQVCPPAAKEVEVGEEE